MNTRIFTWKTLCPTKVKNHDLPPVGFSHFTITGKVGYKVTHPVANNSHTNVQHLWTLTHVLVSPRLWTNHSLSKEWIFLLTTTLLTQANCKNNESSNIFAKTRIISINSQSIRFSLFESSQIFQNRKPIFLNFFPKNDVFSFLK